MFRDYFDLKIELERITGRPVELVDASAVRNPSLPQLLGLPGSYVRPEVRHASSQWWAGLVGRPRNATGF